MRLSIPPAINRDSLVSQLANALHEHQKDQKSLYFVTTTYRQSIDHPLTIRIANANIERFYKSLLSYLNKSRHYNRKKYRINDPIMYGFLDRAFSKFKTYAKPPKHESSLHHHSILITQKIHEATMDCLTDPIAAAAFVERTSKFSKLRTLDVRPIDPSPASLSTVVDYASKLYRQNPVSDSLMIFPKSDDEFLHPKKKSQTNARNIQGPHSIAPRASIRVEVASRR